MSFRSRRYTPNTGRFITRDHVGYVDGPSLYFAAFIPGGLDPNGTQSRPPRRVSCTFAKGNYIWSQSVEIRVGETPADACHRIAKRSWTLIHPTGPSVPYPLPSPGGRLPDNQTIHPCPTTGLDVVCEAVPGQGYHVPATVIPWDRRNVGIGMLFCPACNASRSMCQECCSELVRQAMANETSLVTKGVIARMLDPCYIYCNSKYGS